MWYLHNIYKTVTSYEIKLFSFLQDVGAYSLIYVILINISNNYVCTMGG